MATKSSKLSSRKKSVLELNSMSQAEVERSTSSRVHAGFGVSGPQTRDTLDGDDVSAHQNSHGPGDTFSCRDKVAQNFGTRALSQLVSMVCRSANSGCTAFEETTARTSERRIKHCQHLHSLRSMTDQRAQQQHCVPRKHSVSIRQKQPWHSWRFSDTMRWCYTQTKNMCLCSC